MPTGPDSVRLASPSRPQMREDSSAVGSSHAIEARPSSITEMARKDPLPASGFTAVNGEPIRHTSFRPSDDAASHQPAAPVKNPVRSPSPDRKLQSSTREESQDRDSDNITVGHRPRENGEHRSDPESNNKRKREEQPTQPPNDPAYTDRRSVEEDEASAKRRLTHQLDPPIELNTPNKPSSDAAVLSTERAESEPRAYDHSRSNSSVGRWTRGEPLPPPRPETVDGLAQSLERDLHSRNDQPAAERTGPEEDSTSPKTDPYGQNSGQAYSPDSQNTPGDDAKKRKRVFSNRTKTGCHTCRSRKKKCDEAKPICQNCERGGFQCGGYGAKPPHGFKPSVMNPRGPIALQSKPRYENMHGPTGYYTHPQDDPYGQWNRMPPAPPPPPMEHNRPPNVEQRPPPAMWHKQGWPPNESPLPPLPHVYNHHPDHPLPPPPPLPPAHWQHPPPPPNHNPAYRHSSGNPTRGSESASSTNSQRAAAHSLNYIAGTSHLSEKDKMLLGLPFLSFIDAQLVDERIKCKHALQLYNDGSKPLSFQSSEEQGRNFRAVVDPSYRPGLGQALRYENSYNGPKGHVGSCTVVEAPFHCEYGYNLHLGDDVVVSRNCEMYDSCQISIGNRTIIGPNVKFYTTTALMAPSSRKGTKGCLTGGSITIGDGCFIGGDVIIQPFRKIGNGAVVGAGSVVTKDVKENTVVAGNPARFIRYVEDGANVERHRPEIEEQNQMMLKQMRDRARGWSR